MSRLTNSKKIKLLSIEKARIQLAIDMKNGLITEDDIILLGHKNIEYIFKYTNIRIFICWYVHTILSHKSK